MYLHNLYVNLIIFSTTSFISFFLFENSNKLGFLALYFENQHPLLSLLDIFPHNFFALFQTLYEIWFYLRIYIYIFFSHIFLSMRSFSSHPCRPLFCISLWMRDNGMWNGRMWEHRVRNAWYFGICWALHAAHRVFGRTRWLGFGNFYILMMFVATMFGT